MFTIALQMFCIDVHLTYWWECQLANGFWKHIIQQIALTIGENFSLSPMLVRLRMMCLQNRFFSENLVNHSQSSAGQKMEISLCSISMGMVSEMLRISRNGQTNLVYKRNGNADLIKRWLYFVNP